MIEFNLNDEEEANQIWNLKYAFPRTTFNFRITIKLQAMLLKKICFIFELKVFHLENIHYVKSGCIRSFSGPYFSTFGLKTDQKNCQFGHFSRSGRRGVAMTPANI